MIKCGHVVPLRDEDDLETLRETSLLLDRENQRLITKNLELTAELARLCGLPAVEQLTFGVERNSSRRARPSWNATGRTRRLTRPDGHRKAMGHPQPALPVVEIRHELSADQRACPACGGTPTELAGQAETAGRIRTAKATYHVEHHVRQKYRCACNGAVVTAPAPPKVIPVGATVQRSSWRNTPIISRANARCA